MEESIWGIVRSHIYNAPDGTLAYKWNNGQSKKSMVPKRLKRN